MLELGIEGKGVKSVGRKQINIGILPEQARELVNHDEDSMLVYDLLKYYAERSKKEVCFCKKCKQFYIYKKRTNNGCTKELCIICANEPYNPVTCEVMKDFYVEEVETRESNFNNDSNFEDFFGDEGDDEINLDLYNDRYPLFANL